jgi:nicotinate-nucleotide pyrophosphorylase (carboxylating)
MVINRPQITNELFNQKNRLTVSDAFYKSSVFKYTFLELERDLEEEGDITTDGLIKKDVKATARVYANENGFISGIEEVEYFVSKSDPVFRPRLNALEIKKLIEDGDEFKKDDAILELKGYAKDILKSERTILNLLQHMSGITTHAKKITDLIKNIENSPLIVPTRKTTWGLLDKKALTAAGCGTHRLNLSDAVLIKDNHLALFKNDIKKALFAFHPPVSNYKFFEIEIDDQGKITETSEIIYEMQKNKALPEPAVIMLDNMDSETISASIEKLKSRDLYSHILIEASGGINKKNIYEYAKTGADIISMGSLTQNIKPIDLSLEIKIL